MFMRFGLRRLTNRVSLELEVQQQFTVNTAIPQGNWDTRPQADILASVAGIERVVYRKRSLHFGSISPQETENILCICSYLLGDRKTSYSLIKKKFKT